MKKISIEYAGQFLRHCEELEKLGAKDGIEAYEKLSNLERKAHKLAEDCCNFLDAESPEAEKRSEQIHKKIVQIFGCEPEGFFINYDPRGYALKIREEINTKFPRIKTALMYERYISYTDMGGYGILAPDFN